MGGIPACSVAYEYRSHARRSSPANSTSTTSTPARVQGPRQRSQSGTAPSAASTSASATIVSRFASLGCQSMISRLRITAQMPNAAAPATNQRASSDHAPLRRASDNARPLVPTLGGSARMQPALELAQLVRHRLDHLLLPDRTQERSVLVDPTPYGFALRCVAREILRVAVAHVEVDRATAT